MLALLLLAAEVVGVSAGLAEPLHPRAVSCRVSACTAEMSVSMACDALIRRVKDHLDDDTCLLASSRRRAGSTCNTKKEPRPSETRCQSLRRNWMDGEAHSSNPHHLWTRSISYVNPVSCSRGRGRLHTSPQIYTVQDSRIALQHHFSL